VEDGEQIEEEYYTGGLLFIFAWEAGGTISKYKKRQTPPSRLIELNKSKRPSRANKDNYCSCGSQTHSSAGWPQPEQTPFSMGLPHFSQAVHPHSSHIFPHLK